MATTIQQIELPKKARALDTSGNNNHGQIYSGRGLEFDGVSDHLSLTKTDISTDAWTVAAWIYTGGILNGVADNVMHGGSGNRSANYISVRANNRVAIYDHAAGTFREANTVLNDNTWYRVLWVYDGAGEITFYVNGVADGTGVVATSGTNDDLVVQYIGSLNGTSRWWNGMLSDFQAWDVAWTAADATYDYLNLESLALNAGGTSLTESNLKLWYPMQDGHRGQQSYILDGANTGLGVEEVTNGDFATDSDWNEGTNVDISNGKTNFVDAAKGERQQQDFGFTNGQTYKIVFTVSNYTSGNLGIYMGGAYVDNSINEDGTYTYYHTPTSGAEFFFRAMSNSPVLHTFSIDNVSIKPINDKNHATTVFYGDELVTNGTFTGITQAASTAGSEWTTGAGWTIGSGIASRASESENTYLSQNVAIVAGRTYEVKYDRTYASGGGETNLYSEFVTDGSSTTLGSLNSTVVETVTVTDTFTPTYSGDMLLRVYGIGDFTGTMDNITVKEIGVASGWTDADQQLHIPQPALQSYNELAWFDGEGDYIDINPSTAIWNGSDGEWNSVSCWVNETGLDSGIFYWSAGFNPGLYVKIDGSNHLIGYNTGNGEQFGITIASTSIINKWNHWVMNFKRNSNSDDTAISDSDVELFLNGVKQTLSYVSGSNSNSCDTSTTQNIELMSHGTNYFTTGVMTEVSTWKDQLSDAEVSELFNDGKALDASTHSNANLSAYWRNNGLSTWTNLVNPGTNDGTPTSLTETILIPQGVDSSRDNQGFIMNRQKDTSSLNLPYVTPDGVVGGNGNYVDIPSFDFHATTMSVSFWIKARSLAVDATILDKYVTTDNKRALRLYIKSSQEFLLQLSSDGSATEAQTTTDANLAVDTWHHIAITYSSGTWLVYKDTDAVSLNAAAFTEVTSIEQNTAALRVGHSQDVKDPFDGEIDNLLIYNDVLTSAEVERNYNATKGSHRN